jgi:hypothetical protein
MAGAVLEADDRSHLLRMMRRQTNSHVHRRMNVLLLLDGDEPIFLEGRLRRAQAPSQGGRTACCRENVS